VGGLFRVNLTKTFGRELQGPHINSQFIITMRTQAIVTLSAGAPLSMQDIDLDELRPNECLVKRVATGTCHTAQEGSSIVKYPIVLGHEG
jgi:hypothetical protein